MVMTPQPHEEPLPRDLAASPGPPVMHDLDFDYHCYLRTLDAEPPAMLRDVATLLRSILRGPIWLIIVVASALITVGIVGLLGLVL